LTARKSSLSYRNGITITTTANCAYIINAAIPHAIIPPKYIASKLKLRNSDAAFEPEPLQLALALALELVLASTLELPDPVEADKSRVELVDAGVVAFTVVEEKYDNETTTNVLVLT